MRGLRSTVSAVLLVLGVAACGSSGGGVAAPTSPRGSGSATGASLVGARSTEVPFSVNGSKTYGRSTYRPITAASGSPPC